DSPHVAPQLLDKNWHHVVVTFQRNGNGSTYVDGNLANATSLAPDAGKTAGNIDTDTLGLAVNIGQDGTGKYTDGNQASADMLMDDLAIWKRVLTSDEVACIFTHGQAGTSFDLALSQANALSLRASLGLGDTLNLTWSGGTPPYLVQRKTSLSESNWFNVLTT